jgi:hypothetical protein
MWAAIAAFLTGVLPWYWRAAALILVAAGLFGFGYVRGKVSVQDEWDAAIANQRVRIGIVKQKQAEATVRIVTDYVERVRVVKEKGATLIREVPKYVTLNNDTACAIPAGFVRLHNSAAVGLPLPVPAADLDARTADAQNAAR